MHPPSPLKQPPVWPAVQPLIVSIANCHSHCSSSALPTATCFLPVRPPMLLLSLRRNVCPTFNPFRPLLWLRPSPVPPLTSQGALWQAGPRLPSREARRPRWWWQGRQRAGTHGLRQGGGRELRGLGVQQVWPWAGQCAPHTGAHFARRSKQSGKSFKKKTGRAAHLSLGRGARRWRGPWPPPADGSQGGSSGAQA